MVEEYELPVAPSLQEKISDRKYFEKLQKESSANQLQFETQIAGELLENEQLATFTDYEMPVDKDAIKANVNPLELSAVRQNGVQQIMLAFYGGQLKQDFSPTALALIQFNSLLNNTSRGKNGWAGYLSRTNKSVSETTLLEKAQEIHGQQPQRKGLIGKFLGR
ncbi:MAG: hypothetical protein H7836_10810 [Magnetococcus sp. YQC-3]